MQAPHGVTPGESLVRDNIFPEEDCIDQEPECLLANSILSGKVSFQKSMRVASNPTSGNLAEVTPNRIQYLLMDWYPLREGLVLRVEP